jgi:probable F420-dependent oxidoreductase
MLIESRTVPVSVAVGLTHLDHALGGTVGPLLDTARTVDELGFAQIVLSEHVALGKRTPGHPGSAVAFPFTGDEPYPEPLALLAAMAAVTRQVVLSTGILIAPLRSAVMVAKLAATVDWVSGGRFELGVGSGWHDAEFEACGVPLDERVGRLDDTLRVCRNLWSGTVAPYSSPYTTFGEISMRPLPLQDRLPIWVAGAANVAMARRVAGWGDGWSAIGSTTRDDVARGADLLRAAYDMAGRDPATVRVRCTPLVGRDLSPAARLEAWIDAVPALVEAGATIVQLPLPAMVRQRDEVEPALERVGAALLA